MRSIALATGLLLGATMAAMSQTIPHESAASGDVALTYHWVRSNTQPGDCGCFDLNGGGISGSWNVRSQLAVMAEISGEYAGSGPSTGNSLTLTSYLGGARYVLPQRWLGGGAHGARAFVQVLMGVGHAGGGIAGAGDGTTAFATRIGGGIDVPMSTHFAIRIIQVDYDLTEFKNTSTDRQNNLLLAAGIVYRWSPKHYGAGR
jgi:outer membrane immunogenic protein